MQDREQRWATEMRAAQRGCGESYIRLLGDIAQSLRPLMAGDLRRFGLQESDAEDVIQEVLLAIHLKRDTWSDDRPFLPWLRAIARHKLIDFARRRRRRGEVPIEEVAGSLPAEAPAAPSAVPLQRLLNELPQRQREVVESLAVAGASVGETADKLNMSRGAVYVAFHRGLAALALKFGEWG